MAAISFLGDLLQTVTDRGRGLIGLARAEGAAKASPADLVSLCEDLLSRRGEASGVALAHLILERYAALTEPERDAFLRRAATSFGADHASVEAAIAAYRDDPSRAALGQLHEAAEPRSQELIRRLNLAPRGTLALVRMREDLFALRARLAKEPQPAPAEPALREAADALDADFAHLFSSWFNRGFLVLRRIDWTTPAHILDRIIRYEAVHEIADWDDLRRRTEPADRRCFAFFHPALGDEPLIFVEVALTPAIPDAIGPILAERRPVVGPGEFTTAVFYSISNCQKGLAGVSFGNFLIKQVVEDLRREMPGLKTFVTLSPVPGFRRWLDRERALGHLPADDVETLRVLDIPGWDAEPARAEAVRRAVMPAAAAYFLRAKSGGGRPLDPVARFHLGNGARLERLNFLGDRSAKGFSQSHGLMVNYLYDLAQIERNHEVYADGGTVTAAPAVSRELRPERAPAEA